MTIGSRMSFIIELIGPELSELSALELENLPYLTLLTLLHLQILTNQYQTWPQYIYTRKVSDEFDYGSNWTRTSGVISPWIWKNCWIWLCLHCIIYKYWPISTKLSQNMCDHKISKEFDYGSYRTRTVWMICPWIRKFAIFDFVNTLASANIDQSVPNMATIYTPIRSQMSSIMGQIELEHPESFALEFGKIAEYDFVYTIIYKYWPISTKLGQNVCDHKISNEFSYGFNRTRTVPVICPWIRKFARFDFVYTLATANIDQSVPNLATIYLPIRSRMSLIMEKSNQKIRSHLPLNLENFLNMTLFTL